jgi:cation:H+ antiporter
VLAVGATVPALLLRATGADWSHAVLSLLFGLGIVGAAFLLSWAAEVLQLDISAGLALAVLALIAVLPEYAVDFVFTWQGGRSFAQHGVACPALSGGTESPCSLALANMTGANRLLIGIGWTMVVFIAWWRHRVRAKAGDSASKGWTRVRLDRSKSIELSFLAAATIYSLTLPLRHSITLIDTAVLVGLFVAYMIRISGAPSGEPHLVGPARWLGGFDRATVRRAAVAAMLLFAAGVIVLCADTFAENLVEAGKQYGLSEFLLVQWVAPLASEAPELLVAGLFAWRLNTNAGLGALVSSKVNQWTLLVGTLPLVFAVASHSLHGLPIGVMQREELFLTAAQSFFAVAVLSDLSLSVREAWLLFGLFWAQFALGAVVPDSIHGVERVAVGVVYLVLGAFVLLRDRARMPTLLHDGFRTPHDQMAAGSELTKGSDLDRPLP